MPPEFNVEQQAFPEAVQAGKAWTWSALRPSVVCGFAPCLPMSLAAVKAGKETVWDEIVTKHRLAPTP
jgi:hypothetical protein